MGINVLYVRYIGVLQFIANTQRSVRWRGCHLFATLSTTFPPLFHFRSFYVICRNYLDKSVDLNEIKVYT